METWTWSAVWRRRLARHWLLAPAPRDRMLEVVGDVCGIHAQMAPSAELSLGLRVAGITRSDVRTALWDERTLVKTYGLRGTLHLFPSSELNLWLAALRAKAPPRAQAPTDSRTLAPRRRDQVVRAIDDALTEREMLTREELEVEVERRVGGWATEPAFEAFGGHLARWQLGLHGAAHDGAIVFGPNRGNRVTYVRTAAWLGTLPSVDGDLALREVCLRFLGAYGPATSVEFARWFATSPKAAKELMQSLELEEVNVEGWRAWLPREGVRRDERRANDTAGRASRGGGRGVAAAAEHIDEEVLQGDSAQGASPRGGDRGRARREMDGQREGECGEVDQRARSRARRERHACRELERSADERQPAAERKAEAHEPARPASGQNLEARQHDHGEAAHSPHGGQRAARETEQARDETARVSRGAAAHLAPGAGVDPGEERAAVHLLPHFDCYVVGGFPRDQLIPETAPAQLRKGTAAPFSVLLIDGVVAGLWERRTRGKRLEVRVHAFAQLSATQRREIERQAARIGEIVELGAVVSFGYVEPRGHL